MISEPWTPRLAVLRAVMALQSSNLEALRTGEGRGNSTRQMAGILDRELGYSEMYEALDGVMALVADGKLVRDTSSDANQDWALRQMALVLALKAAGDALAKARGEMETSNHA